MIINIPKPEEFIATGVALFNMSWDVIFDLLIDLDNAEIWDDEADEAENDFWSLSKRQMMNSVALIQQGVEFILKGKICEISPFLLIYDSPKNWPGSFSKGDTHFSEFRMVDSQDLVRLYNTVSSRRLSDKFTDQYNEMRKKRNAIMHSLPSNVEVNAVDIVVDILSMYDYLFDGNGWVGVRREYLEEGSISRLYSPDWVDIRIVQEFIIVLEILKPAELKKFFNFNKRQRRYICPVCMYGAKWGVLEPRTAVLKPNKPSSDNLYCFVCGHDMKVKRKQCNSKKCNGNVICVDDGICVSCGRRQRYNT